MNTSKIVKTVDYDKIPVPQPVYAPFPAATAGVKAAKMSLNGEWKFNPTPDANFPTKFGGNWQSIQVPGHWATQGFTVEDGTYAGYSRSFNVPTDWINNRIRIRFDSVFSDCVVYVNGEEVGKHLGTFTAFELDVTDQIRNGKNTISLKVRNDSMADNLGSLNQYANFPLGGIPRKVTLYAVPQVFLTDARIDTRFAADFNDAVLNLQFDITNSGQESCAAAQLVVSVPGVVEPYTIWVPYLEEGITGTVTASIPVKAPKKWDNEHPNLYTLECKLISNGKQIEKISKRFGFRQVEVRGNRMVINDKPIKLAGVCRHEAHPLLGRSLTIEEWRKDAELYMTGNVNFIRTSHYPPSEEFIQVCDELGLFVELEAPINWIGLHGANKSWRKLDFNSKKWYPYILQANMETVRFHRNNPSIIFWSLANESHWSENFAQVLKRMRLEDKTRPFTFHDQDYGEFNNLGSNAPVANIHYPGPNGEQAAKGYNRPITFGEYCHLNVYNRQELVADPGVRNTWGDCLERIWNKMYKTDACLGGSIWSGIDDLFLLPNGTAVGYGAWGPIDGWRRPKPEYFYLKKVYSPIKLVQKKLAPVESKLCSKEEIILDVENRHNFTNVNELAVKWSIGERKGEATADVLPHTIGKLSIPTYVAVGETLAIDFFSPKGYLIDRFELKVGGEQANKTASVIKEKPVKLEMTANDYIIKGKGSVCHIDKKSGMITKVVKNGRKVIEGGANLVINELKGGECYPNHSADTPVWDPLCEGWKATNVKVKKQKNAIIVTTTGKYNEAEGNFIYTVNGNGVIETAYEFKMLKKVNPRQVGLAMFLSKEFDQVKWQRTSNFSGFPKEHIGRLNGEAKALYHGFPDVKVAADGSVKRKFIRKQPKHPWCEDANELGSANFRGTRTGILYYEMKSKSGDVIRLESNGTQAARCRLDGDKVRLICADIDTGGAELYLDGHLHYLRKPLAKGAVVKGMMKIIIK